MNRKLLDKTLRVYVLFSVVVLLISAPLFYYLANKLFIDDADETLILRKNEFIAHQLPKLKLQNVEVLNSFNRDIKLEKSNPPISKDSIFYQFHYDSLANENEPYRVLYSSVSVEHQPFLLTTRINLVESEDMIMAIAELFILILAILLTGLYFITRRLSAKIWKPFYTTLAQLEEFDLDKNTNATLAVSTTEEFNRLNQSIMLLLERNLSVYKSQKEFIENASHELQTPLAAIQAKIDMLAQQLPFTNEIGNTLSDLNDSIARLTRLNKNLLLLSKIENHQYAATETFAVDDILKKHLAFFSEQAEEKNIKINLKYIETCVQKANVALLEVAISNLLLNSVRHNHHDGQISVSLNQSKFVVSNTGKNNSLEKGKLFQRFSQQDSEAGDGLGLSIVKRIADIHGWKLTYKYEDQNHVFVLEF